MRIIKTIFAVAILSLMVIVPAHAADPNNRKEGAAWGDLNDKKAAIKAQNALYEAARNADPSSGYRARSKAAKEASAAARAANKAKRAEIEAANVARGRPSGNS